MTFDVGAATAGLPIAMVLALGGPVGCKKKKKRTKLALQCKLPASLTKEVIAKAKAPYSYKRRKRWLDAMLSHCTGWPDLVYLLIATEAGTETAKRREIGRKGASKAEMALFDKRLERMCPGIIKALERLGGVRPRDRRAHLAKQCPRDWPIVTREEFALTPLNGLYATLAFELLREAGIPEPVARPLARQMLNFSSFVQKEGELMYPQSSTTIVTRGVPQLDVAASNMLVDHELSGVKVKDGKTAASAKPGGPQSYLLAPLRDKLKALKRTALRRLGDAKGRSRGELLVGVHQNLPFRVFSEALHTARAAGFSRFGLAVISRERRAGVLPFDLAGPPGPTGPNLTVVFEPRRFVATLEGDAPPKAFPFGAEKKARLAAQAALVKFLRQRALKLKAAGPRGVIRVEVADTVRVRDVANLLDALRDKPGAPGRCRVTVDKRTHRWHIPPAMRAHCFYALPRIHVGPAPQPAAPPKDGKDDKDGKGKPDKGKPARTKPAKPR